MSANNINYHYFDDNRDNVRMAISSALPLFLHLFIILSMHGNDICLHTAHIDRLNYKLMQGGKL